MMLLGWGILAVPTGIVTAEMTHRRFGAQLGRVCPRCGTDGHAPSARFCEDCGASLNATPAAARRSEVTESG